MSRGYYDRFAAAIPATEASALGGIPIFVYDVPGSLCFSASIGHKLSEESFVMLYEYAKRRRVATTDGTSFVPDVPVYTAG